MMTTEFVQLLLLIIIANGAPILIRVLLNDNLKLAVDFGQKLPDNNRVFGPSKTWRGILASLSVTTLAAWLISLPPETGLLIAIYSVSGDLVSSFIKRRLGMPPSTMAPLLDQVPESLLPAYMMMDIFNLEIYSVILLVLFFIVSELILSRIFFLAGIRRRPY